MKQIERFRDMRREIEQSASYSAEKHAAWKNRTSGPNWPILRRYVRLLEVCQEQAEYIEELNGIIEDLDSYNGNIPK